MQVDTIAVRLRLRPPLEAADVGVRLCQESWRSVYSCYAFAAVPLLALCLATFEIATWLPMVVLWWVKPWLDRSILFALARAAFGQDSTWRDLWRDEGTVWRRQILSSLTIRRLSPWRSLTQPVYQLEGLSGGLLRKRVAQVRIGKTGRGLIVTSAFSLVEIAFVIALFALLFWFALPDEIVTIRGFFDTNGPTATAQLILSIAYALTILFLEPFYVAAGFGMYLGRRVELEAWDIEQELRRAFA